MLVQRLSFVDRPSVANLELLAKARVIAKTKRERSAHHAATFALGSSIGRLAQVDRAAAERFDDVLIAELAVAKSTDDKSALLAGIGNAALQRDLPLIVSYARDKSEDVRAQTATSLRRFSDAPAMLYTRFGNTGLVVSRLAFGAMTLGDVAHLTV